MIHPAMNKRGPRAISVLVIAALLVLSVALLQTGCGGSAATTSAVTTASQTTATTGSSGGGGTKVTMKGFAFNPATVTIKVGETVTWENQDGANHNVIADDGSFKSADFGQGKTFSFTFTKAGTYTYSCHIHPNMKGTVIVQ
jgi:plastocyanin